MKKIKKLVLRPGQELGLQEQQLIMAGRNWISEGCSCTMVGNSHREFCKETVWDPDVSGALIGTVTAAGGVATIGASGIVTIVSGGTASLATWATALAGFGVALEGTSSLVTSMSQQKTITHHRLQICDGVGPLTHHPGKEWTD